MTTRFEPTRVATRKSQRKRTFTKTRGVGGKRRFGDAQCAVRTSRRFRPPDTQPVAKPIRFPVGSRNATPGEQAGPAMTEPASPALRALLERLIDYAGTFPPATLQCQAAVANYATYRTGPHAWMLRWLVV